MELSHQSLFHRSTWEVAIADSSSVSSMLLRSSVSNRSAACRNPFLALNVGCGATWGQTRTASCFPIAFSVSRPGRCAWIRNSGRMQHLTAFNRRTSFHTAVIASPGGARYRLFINFNSHGTNPSGAQDCLERGTAFSRQGVCSSLALGGPC